VRPFRPIFRVRRDPAADSGQAMLEFLLAFPPVLLLILMVMEYAFFVNVNHFVQYAAFAAARSRLVSSSDSKNPASAAALAMVPFADAGQLYDKATADAAAASAAADVKSTLATLTSSGAYKGKAVTSQDNRVLNSFKWQTDTWIQAYDKNDKAVTGDDFAYCKAGVCFTYPLRFQVLGPISAWVIRAKDRKSGDASVSSLFGGTSTNAMIPPASKDYWKRADDLRNQTRLVVVPVIQGCILGKR
jgi:Flp pilus assembly protein TadG